MRKVIIDKEKFIMVVIIGRIVAELVLERKVGIESLFIKSRMQKFSDFTY